MITEEMVRVAVKAFREGRNHGDPAGMCAALEAVVPMIRNATLEEAAKVADETFTDEIIPAQPPTEDDIGQPERRVRHHRGSKAIAAAIRALAPSE